MISYEIYKLLHIIGICLLFGSLGGAIFRTLPATGTPDPTRKLLSAAHGIGLLLILVAGFGMAARLGLTSGLPLWVWIKVAIWLVLGGWIALAIRKKMPQPALLFGAVGLGAVAAVLAIFKL